MRCTAACSTTFILPRPCIRTDVLDPVALRNDLIITDLLEIYTYGLLVNTYGNVPYSQAENRSIPFPKYDDARTVFNDLLTRVDTCIAGLNTSGAAMGAEDQIYKGKVSSWLKFAASLKLKLAMFLADVDAATFSKKVRRSAPVYLLRTMTMP